MKSEVWVETLIRNAFALLRLALNMAIADGLLVTNPCKGVELPRPDDEEIHPPWGDERQMRHRMSVRDTAFQ